MTEPNDGRRAPLQELLDIMARLRSPDGGCAWDIDQTFATIAPYTIEEAYEVADAVQRGNLDDLKEELGDLLFQVVFHSRMAEEAGAFCFDDVTSGISEKMIRRHPHVFGDANARTADEQTVAWEEIKAKERAAKHPRAGGLLDEIPLGLPALTRALKLSSRAATVGFVWPSVSDVVTKLHEEVEELEAELACGDHTKIRDELGDVLFVCANIARALDIDPEDALRHTNAKFSRRFAFIESRLAQSGRSPSQSNLIEMDELWNAAKAAES
jgi:tetrapyrrole methylase family protein/MazG family protein/ATP diphosphatase